MYIPKQFKVTDETEIYAFIKANAFGQLTSQVNGRLFSTHIPFLLSDDNTKLICHLAKQNPQIQTIEGQEILVTMQGAHGYISPSWYNTSGVPTWNYQAVHIYGHCKTFNDHDKLISAVNALTTEYESGFATPWQADYHPAMLDAIIGVEITMTEIQCKYKMSQNRSPNDQQQVIEQLKQNGASALANAMTQYRLRPKQ